MKKFFIILLVLIAIFEFASCKQDPKPTDEPTPAPEPASTEPNWESGVLRIGPAEETTFSQDGKFQFKMALEYNAGEPIEFLLKCSPDVTGVEAREGGNGDTFFIPKNTPLSNWEKNADGWYIISIPAEDVIPVGEPAGSLGITARLPNTDRASCYIAIKDMKINDVLIDFTDYIDDEDFISAYATSPEELDVRIVE